MEEEEEEEAQDRLPTVELVPMERSY